MFIRVSYNWRLNVLINQNGRLELFIEWSVKIRKRRTLLHLVSAPENNFFLTTVKTSLGVSVQIILIRNFNLEIGVISL